MDNTNDVPEQARRIEELVRKLELSGDPAIVATAKELVEALMNLHGAALERMLEIVSRAGAAGQEIAEGFGRDDLVGNVLVLYGLHPLDLEARLCLALEKLEPSMRKQSRSIELVSVVEGMVRLRVQSTSSSNGSPGHLRTAIEDALYAAAPDIGHLTIEGLEQNGAGFAFVPIEKLTGAALNGTRGAS